MPISAKVDIVIRNGSIVDGSGTDIREADVAVNGGRIVQVGAVSERGTEEIDARGMLVTPGFVDIHTHYDAQIMWDSRTEPSSVHGVTTVVTGNCGVGFAPCKPEDRGRLIRLMEGVEDIPEVVMSEGLPWNWETFPEFLDSADRKRDVDYAIQLPHSALRVYVMGERGAAREPANEDDLVRMREIAKSAIEAGAIGFATSRSVNHRDSKGRAIPTQDAGESELQAIGLGLKAAGQGVIEALVDFDKFDSEFAILRRLAESSGRPVSFTLTQTPAQPDCWRDALALLDKANTDGIQMRGQVIGRPVGLLLGLQLSLNPFSLYPVYQQIANLPLKERVQILRRPETRDRILQDTSDHALDAIRAYLEQFEWMFPLGDPPNYEPSVESSIASIARRRGVTPQQLAYELMLEDDGEAIFLIPVTNYSSGSLDPVLEMMKDKNTILGLGDGGAHYGMICDASYPTYMLTHWARDRRPGGRLTIPETVKALSSIPARFVGLQDRGIIAPGYKADLNVIDHDRLTLRAPRVVFDLPGGGKRLNQGADGFVATMVSGAITHRYDEFTGALPGRLVRGVRTAPA